MTDQPYQSVGISVLINEAEEEIRRLRRRKKVNCKEFIKYYEGYIHGLKSSISFAKQEVEIALKEQMNIWIEEISKTKHRDAGWFTRLIKNAPSPKI